MEIKIKNSQKRGNYRKKLFKFMESENSGKKINYTSLKKKITKMEFPPSLMDFYC